MCQRVLCGLPYLAYKFAHCALIFVAEFLEHIQDLWNLLDVGTIILTSVTVTRVLLQYDALITCQFAAANTMMLWFRIINLLQGRQDTAKYVKMLIAVMSDMSSFMLMLGIFVAATGFTFLLLFPVELHAASSSNASGVGAIRHTSSWNITDPQAVHDAAGTWSRAMWSSFDLLMGSFDPAVLEDAHSPNLAYAVYLQSVWVTNIIILNLLIAV